MMAYKQCFIGIALLSAIVFFAGGIGCASGPSNDIEEQARAESYDTDFSALEIFEQRAPWLSPETDLVAVVDPSFLFEVFAEMTPAEPGVSRSERGARFRDDVSRIWGERFAIDSVRAEAVLVSVSRERISLFLNGDFSIPEWAEEKTFNGVETHLIRCDCESDDRRNTYYSDPIERFLSESDIWIVVLDDPSGIVIFFDESEVDEATERISKEAMSRDEFPRMDKYRELIEGGDGGRLVVASSQGNQTLRGMIGVPSGGMPDDTVISVGSMARFSFSGPSEQLDAIEEPVDHFLVTGREVSAELREPRGHESLSYALMEASGGFLVGLYLDSLTVERQTNTLSYETALPKSLLALLMSTEILGNVVREVQGRLYPPPSPSQADFDMLSVAVAARDISAGTPLESGDLTTQQVPVQFLPANPLLAPDIDIYLGQPVAIDIAMDSMILTSDFVKAEPAKVIDEPEEIEDDEAPIN